MPFAQGHFTDGWGGQEFGHERWGHGYAYAGPSVQNVDPPPGVIVGEIQPISFSVVSPAPLFSTLVVTAEYPKLGIFETVYDGSALTVEYRNPQSSIVTVSGGYHFTLLRAGLWPAGSVKIKITASDSEGYALSVTLEWLIAEKVFTTVTTHSLHRTKFDPLGYGLRRPFRRTSANDFNAAMGSDLVRAQVGQVLGTALGEVRWRPSFGTLLNRLKHVRNTQAVPVLARISIENALRRWVPRAEIVDLTAEPIVKGTENKVLLSLSYVVGSSNPERVGVEI